jgi:hypothetical protein
VAEVTQGFGRPNPDCSKCGDERGGLPGHDAGSCQWFPGMSVFLLTRLPHMAGREAEIWDVYVNRYLDAQLNADQPGA